MKMVWEMLLKDAGEMKIPTCIPFQELVAIGMFLVYLFLVSFSENEKYLWHCLFDRHSRPAAEIRDSFKDYFCTKAGEVSWQYDYVRRKLTSDSSSLQVQLFLSPPVC